MYNFSGKDVILPPYTPIGQYIVSPEVSSFKYDMTVDEIVNAVHVPEGEEGERARDILRRKLFEAREERRRYFSKTRIGRGAGIPPADFEETEEFKSSGRPPPAQAPRPVSGE